MRVILAEDDPLTLRLLQLSLTEWGYEVQPATTGTDAWELAEHNDQAALAIIDWMMPGMDGVEICRRVRANGGEPYLYIILLTERRQPADVALGLESGADDFVIKPFDEQELYARLKVGERILGLHTELVTAREAMRARATIDTLTGLPNRAAILDILSKEMNRARREHAPLAVAMADVDCFKQINDAHGHLVGDRVLREVATRMVATLRSYESVGRYGGDEFLLVLPGCDGAVGHALAEKLLAAVAGTTIDLGDTGLSVTCSLGVTCYGGAGMAAIDLVGAGDAALYRAKFNGRNRVESTEAHRARRKV
jgi:diguanylate cyclase (GGDEF)-like protein